MIPVKIEGQSGPMAEINASAPRPITSFIVGNKNQYYYYVNEINTPKPLEGYPRSDTPISEKPIDLQGHINEKIIR